MLRERPLGRETRAGRKSTRLDVGSKRPVKLLVQARLPSAIQHIREHRFPFLLLQHALNELLLYDCLVFCQIVSSSALCESEATSN